MFFFQIEIISFAGSPAKRRRTYPAQSNPPLSAPPVRRRFDSALQSTAASLMGELMYSLFLYIKSFYFNLKTVENVAVGTTTSTSKSTAVGNRPITEASQNGY